ncbi:beta-1,4-galactosyltransferase 1-like isoform X2 [Corticium candelabrum]|uniref:beta-1,4-galactosyltransferase 1-like isoform X2 n=1 Tax=Corticium candelabrum TaxID=121492 RepID=UPI002E271A0E|nr:beta-1,4-galactosyltransferase 1-like isoform X2 [Corticium candelabrum]
MHCKLRTCYALIVVSTCVSSLIGLFHLSHLYQRFSSWRLTRPHRYCGLSDMSFDESVAERVKTAALLQLERGRGEGGRRISALPACSEKSRDLGLQGRRVVNMSLELTIEQLNAKETRMKNGGYYKPTHCHSQHKVAIIIPYRDRYSHLLLFLHYMLPIFIRQNIEFRLYIIEQAGDCPFNRGMLFNVGVLEASKDETWDCYCFHDVDLMLEDDRCLYTCPKKGPRALAIALDKWNYEIIHKYLFGGIVIMSRQQILSVNGFSNLYWGWGGEDDDLLARVEMMGMKVEREDKSVARYTTSSQDHISAPQNPVRFDLLFDARYRVSMDGLDTTVHKVISRKEFPLYTIITVALGDTDPTSR